MVAGKSASEYALDVEFAPTYYPNEEDFADPLAYIAKVRLEAEKYGICKIVPPPGWKNPWAQDRKKYKFNTRIQALNELQNKSAGGGTSPASTTFKHDYVEFLGRIGRKMARWPVFSGRELDMAVFYGSVQRFGGFEAVTNGKKWREIARILKTRDTCTSASFALRQLYHKHLLGYEQYQTLLTLGDERKVQTFLGALAQLEKGKAAVRKRGEAAPRPLAAGAGAGGAAPAKLAASALPAAEHAARPSGKPVAANGGGEATMHRPSYKIVQTEGETEEVYYDQICEVCKGAAHEDKMILCDRCDCGYHMYCLSPPLEKVPDGDWFCARCIQEERDADIGFTDGHEYTVEHLAQLDSKMRKKVFGSVDAPKKMSYSQFEAEFWKIVEEAVEPIEVVYGADIDTGTHGSGFPRDDSFYGKSPWNLNNLPRLTGQYESMLRTLEDGIPGVIVPWMYVGMTFSSFCWHVEDHFLYSMNYHHWGEPKTWYSVPSHAADLFEEAFRAVMPEQFAVHPDLLLQLVTMLSPRLLRKHGCPVYQCVQEENNFIVTFPRAYHGGFNHGLNCAEAVNFAPADWAPFGRTAVERMRFYRRGSVVSHEELMVAASGTEDCSPRTAAWMVLELGRALAEERAARARVHGEGVSRGRRLPPGLGLKAGDKEDAECTICKYYLHVSGVQCTCDPSRAACLHHSKELCECPPENKVLLYRYALRDMEVALDKMKARAAEGDAHARGMPLEMYTGPPGDRFWPEAVEAAPAAPAAPAEGVKHENGAEAEVKEEANGGGATNGAASGATNGTKEVKEEEDEDTPRATGRRPRNPTWKAEEYVPPEKRSRGAGGKQKQYRAAVPPPLPATMPPPPLSAPHVVIGLAGAHYSLPPEDQEGGPGAAARMEAFIARGKRFLAAPGEGAAAEGPPAAPRPRGRPPKNPKPQAEALTGPEARAAGLRELLADAGEFLWGGRGTEPALKMAEDVEAAVEWTDELATCLHKRVALPRLEALLARAPPPLAAPPPEDELAALRARAAEGRAIADRIVALLATRPRAQDVKGIVAEAEAADTDIPEAARMHGALVRVKQWEASAKRAFPKAGGLAENERAKGSARKAARKAAAAGWPGKPAPPAGDIFTLEALEAMHAAAEAIPLSSPLMPVVQAGRDWLAGWQERAVQLLNSQPQPPALVAVNALLAEADRQCGMVPEMATLDALATEGSEWVKKRDAAIKAKAPLADLRALVKKSRELRVGVEEELKSLEVSVRSREWGDSVGRTLAGKGKPTLGQLQELQARAAVLGVPPKTGELERLSHLVEVGAGWERRAKTALMEGARGHVAMDEMNLLAREGAALGVKLERLPAVSKAVSAAREWSARADAALRPKHGTRKGDAELPTIAEIEQLIDEAGELLVVPKELRPLQDKLQKVYAWQERYEEIMSEGGTYADVPEMQSLIKEGEVLSVEMEELSQLVARCAALEWESKAKEALAVDKPKLSDLQDLLKGAYEAQSVDPQLKGQVERKVIAGEVWEARAEEALDGESQRLEYSELSEMLEEGRTLGIEVDAWARLEEALEESRAWEARASKAWNESPVQPQAAPSEVPANGAPGEAGWLTGGNWNLVPFRALKRLHKEEDSSPVLSHLGTEIADAVESAEAWKEQVRELLAPAKGSGGGMGLRRLVDRVRASCEAALKACGAEHKIIPAPEEGDDMPPDSSESESDSPAEDPHGEDVDKVYCVCQRKFADGHGKMVGCDVCDDWYHVRCVGLNAAQMKKHKGAYTCPFCVALRDGQPLALDEAHYEKSVRATRRPLQFKISKLLMETQGLRCRVEEAAPLGAALRMFNAWRAQIAAALQTRTGLDPMAVPLVEDDRFLSRLYRSALAIEVDASHEVANLRQALAVSAWRRHAAAGILKPGVRPTFRAVQQSVRSGTEAGLDGADGMFKRALMLAARAESWQEAANAALNRKPLNGSELGLLRDQGRELPVALGSLLRKVEETSTLYCICQRPYDEERPMLACDTCDGWYHYDCCGLNPPQESDDDDDVAPETYKCPICCRREGGAYTMGFVNNAMDPTIPGNIARLAAQPLPPGAGKSALKRPGREEDSDDGEDGEDRAKRRKGAGMPSRYLD